MAEPKEILIAPKKNWQSFGFDEVWEKRDLFFILVWRDFVSRYTQTLLGPLWFILQPVMQTLLFAFVFGRIARLTPEGIPAILFYLSTLLGWTFFSLNFSGTSNSLVNNAHLFGKVYFPRLIPPMAACASNIFAFGIHLALYVVIFLVYKFTDRALISLPTGATFIFAPLIGLHILLLSLGMGLWISALSSKYRDLSHLLGFIIQIWMYLSPVIYPIEQLGKLHHGLEAFMRVFNPMAEILEALRWSLLGQGTPSLAGYSCSLAITLFTFFSGVLIYHRAERTFVDTV